ncbi:unnamed protein product [Cylindrotheca closterium]|uniref:Uncharacterized protein n=1 Tax=Cylindrotheca closterium TaxID=2856 RepID=A0AAD2JL19_9STRA|nr:unnamed protein product [Cylindrotheca closterium]
MEASLGLATTDISANQNKTDNDGGEDTTTSSSSQPMDYCASTIAPPAITIPVAALSKVTPVAAPLTKEQLQSIPRKHDIVCKCGCIPAIPSMFQMAELRKQAAREKKNKAKQIL